MSMSMLQWLNVQMAKSAKVTKQSFGRAMHDKNVTEAEKKKILEQLEKAGGYENLPDEF